MSAPRCGYPDCGGECVGCEQGDAARRSPTDNLLVARLLAAYQAVAEWPEKRMPGVDITTLGEGFSDLLRLRNIVPEAAAQLAAVTAENARLRERIEQAYKAGFDFAMMTEAPK